MNVINKYEINKFMKIFIRNKEKKEAIKYKLIIINNESNVKLNNMSSRHQ